MTSFYPVVDWLSWVSCHHGAQAWASLVNHFVQITENLSRVGAFGGACRLDTNSLIFWVHSEEFIQLFPKLLHHQFSGLFLPKLLII